MIQSFIGHKVFDEIRPFDVPIPALADHVPAASELSASGQSAFALYLSAIGILRADVVHVIHPLNL
jgi:hypothetical protein